jgi:ATP-dependent 26S proteasome regulatory subunit
MNSNLRSLMTFVADNQMDKARDFVKKFCESNEVKSDYGYCNMLLSQLRRSGGYLMELPSDIQSLLFKEDVSGIFIPERYYVSEREAALTERILRKNRSAQRLANAGINYLNATLLYGESGTGKTQFGRYLAYTMGVPFCYFNLSRTVDSLMGGTSKNLNKVFNYIKGTPCVFMIDELDAVSSNRAHSDSTSASGEMNRTTISLMQNLDQLSSDVVLLAATNRPELIDDAVKRRFSIRHEVQVLSPEELLQMSEHFLADVKAHADFRVEYDREELVRYCASGVKQSEVIDMLTESLAEAVEKDTAMHFPD